MIDVAMADSAEGGGQPPPAKKGLNDLNKEELVAKCKGLLQIAQKAKAAKDGEREKSFEIELLLSTWEVLSVRIRLV